MASIGSIRPAILSASNENTLSLASIKFDFSLIKVEAPVEFEGLGSALSLGRRYNAEFGAPHRTARRLGALFEQLIPSTPSLITAYGKRVSDVIKTPGVNPIGSSSHGPFESFVGAEGTALWAAATSGIPALGIYLLACLLARAWDAKESTAIWVELVEGRREEIEIAVRRNDLVSEGTLFASSQEISRQDLGKWDASARAWLRSADEAMGRKQKQLMLILHNVSIPFTGGPSTYVKVLEAWKQAMMGMESLLRGHPQMITTGSVLLALSAWHLYPDLVVLGERPTSVIFKDDLVPPLGVGTIGLQSSDNKPPQWSLALSHLQYYGGPVDVESTKDSSRVSMDQFYIVVLGSLFYDWRLKVSQLASAVRWFHDFWKTLEQVELEAGTRDTMLTRFDWILRLARAAHMVMESLHHKDDEPISLLKFGHRRAKVFLSEGARSTPFFGLQNPCVIVGLREKLDIECGIGYLRRLAHDLKLQDKECVIRYNQNDGASHEYATAIPHVRRGAVAADADTLPGGGVLHARWLVSKVHTSSFQTRIAKILLRGECGILVADTPSLGSTDNEGRLIWKNPPRLYLYKYGRPVADPLCTSRCISKNACPCLAAMFDLPQRAEGRGGEQSSEFRLIVGSWDLGLYMNMGSDSLLMSSNEVGKRAAKAMSISKDPRKTDLFGEDVSRERLFDYMCTITSPKGPRLTIAAQHGPGTKLLAWQLLNTDSTNNTTVFTSLRAMSLAYGVYRRLKGATVSLKAVGKPIHKALWVPKYIYGDYGARVIERETADPLSPLFEPAQKLGPLSRAEALACIAFLESGSTDLDPAGLHQTLAVCSENSIFVAGVVLADPFERLDASDVRKIVGNIGRTGICMLVAPKEPRIKSLGDTFNIVNHEQFDLMREDHFRGTSLHLSFTNWTLPIDTQTTRTIDSDVAFVESVISVRDRGEWVADLDILAIDFDTVMRHDESHSCRHKSQADDKSSTASFVSLDSWEELIDRPEEGIGILRAQGNWAVRLAALSILTQQGFAETTKVAGPSIEYCLRCLEAELFEAGLKSKAKREENLEHHRKDLEEDTESQRNIRSTPYDFPGSGAFCID